jgi:WD40 repeat protein
MSVKVWNVSNYSNTSTLKAHSDWVTSVACSPDSKYIASGSYGNPFSFFTVYLLFI